MFNLYSRKNSRFYNGFSNVCCEDFASLGLETKGKLKSFLESDSFSFTSIKSWLYVTCSLRLSMRSLSSLISLRHSKMLLSTLSYLLSSPISGANLCWLWEILRTFSGLGDAALDRLLIWFLSCKIWVRRLPIVCSLPKTCLRILLLELV